MILMRILFIPLSRDGFAVRVQRACEGEIEISADLEEVLLSGNALVSKQEPLVCFN